MQLAPQPALPASPLQPLNAALTRQPPATAGAEPAAASPAHAPASAGPTPPSAPVEEASLSARLLGKVGGAQQRFLENQQLLGAVTAMLGARLSSIGSHVMALLKGEATQQDA